MEIIVGLFYLIPKNIISFFCGWLARLRLPQPLADRLNALFVSTFKINMEEAEQPLSAYRTIEDVFTRALKPDSRIIAAKLCSPADGTLSLAGPTRNDEAIQAKGLYYRLDELVFGKNTMVPNKKLAWFYTVYLAPHNYHRVHSPMSGTVERLRYIPGQLWPVNKPFVCRIPNLFSRNERLVFDITSVHGGSVYVVMVGALNVGRISTCLAPDFVTNSLGSQFENDQVELPFKAQPIQAGDELGTFMLGSTAIVVFDEDSAKSFPLMTVTEERSIVMGASLLADG